MKEVIILGCGPTSVECKYHCETWGVNGTYTFAKRLDKLFMTDEESEVNSCWYDMRLIKKVNPTLVFPTRYARFVESGFDKIEIYPIDEIQKKFNRTRFFSNSIAYMLAYALLHEYNRIHLFGIDMMTQSTYLQEKGGIEFWMGIAEGMRACGKDIRINNTKGSATGKTFNGKMYGYWGGLQEEKFKEKLLAPWEIIRVSKASKPQNEWIKSGGEYKLVPAETSRSDQGIPNFTERDEVVKSK